MHAHYKKTRKRVEFSVKGDKEHLVVSQYRNTLAEGYVKDNVNLNTIYIIFNQMPLSLTKLIICQLNIYYMRVLQYI